MKQSSIKAQRTLAVLTTAVNDALGKNAGSANTPSSGETGKWSSWATVIVRHMIVSTRLE